MDLSVTTRTRGDHTVLEIAGEIDVYTSPHLREQLIGLVNDGAHHLILDVENVAFIDSTGLGVLIGTLKRVTAHNGSLNLVCTHSRIVNIFAITGLTKVLPLHDSIEDAAAAR